MRKIISLISAIQVPNRGIGMKGKLLRRIPKDQEFFKETTMGGIVLMGYNTWISIPLKFRYLEGRICVIITASHIDEFKDDPNAFAFSSPDRALAWAMNYPGIEHIWIAGGQKIYEYFLPKCDRVFLTQIPGTLEADTFFPELGNDFKISKTVALIPSEDESETYPVLLYERIAA